MKKLHKDCVVSYGDVRTVGKLKIGFTEYEVIESPYVEIEEDRNYRGKVVFDRCYIELLSSLNQQRKREVLVHEIVHAMIHESSNEKLLGDKEEEFVISFSKVLNQFLIDNTNFHKEFEQQYCYEGE